LIYLREMIKREAKEREKRPIWLKAQRKTNRPGPRRKPPANIMHVGYRGPQVINYKRRLTRR
jgi:hypothetical protein